jgi:hypothetical protein
MNKEGPNNKCVRRTSNLELNVRGNGVNVSRVGIEGSLEVGEIGMKGKEDPWKERGKMG